MSASTGLSDVPCPCGSLDLHMDNSGAIAEALLAHFEGRDPNPDVDPVLYFVDCYGCGSTGPPRETAEGAVSRWEEIHATNAERIREAIADVVARLGPGHWAAERLASAIGLKDAASVASPCEEERSS